MYEKKKSIVKKSLVSLNTTKPLDTSSLVFQSTPEENVESILWVVLRISTLMIRVISQMGEI